MRTYRQESTHYWRQQRNRLATAQLFVEEGAEVAITGRDQKDTG